MLPLRQLAILLLSLLVAAPVTLADVVIMNNGDRLTDWPMHIYGLGAELRLPWRARLNLDAYLVFDYQPTMSELVTSDSGMMLVDWKTAQTADQAFINLRLGRFFTAPGASYLQFEQSLVVLGQSSAPVDPDAELAQGALDLYRDWSQSTLFGGEHLDLETERGSH